MDGTEAVLRLQDGCLHLVDAIASARQDGISLKSIQDAVIQSVNYIWDELEEGDKQERAIGKLRESGLFENIQDAHRAGVSDSEIHRVLADFVDAAISQI